MSTSKETLPLNGFKQENGMIRFGFSEGYSAVWSTDWEGVKLETEWFIKRTLKKKKKKRTLEWSRGEGNDLEEEVAVSRREIDLSVTAEMESI